MITENNSNSNHTSITASTSRFAVENGGEESSLRPADGGLGALPLDSHGVQVSISHISVTELSAPAISPLRDVHHQVRVF